jgi:uncharacterized protein YuzE
MKLTYDSDFNIAYIRFKSNRAKVRTVSVSDELNVDLAPDGSIYGLELLNANAQLGIRRSRKFVVESQASRVVFNCCASHGSI